MPNVDPCGSRLGHEAGKFVGDIRSGVALNPAELERRPEFVRSPE